MPSRDELDRAAGQSEELAGKTATEAALAARLADEQQQRVIEDLETRFKYHPPKEGQAAVYTSLREDAKLLAEHICDAVPYSREQSLALTALEDAVFWANAGIARRS
jgi:hypothetical protein